MFIYFLQSNKFFFELASVKRVIVRIFLIFDNYSINNKATTLCLHT